MHKKGKQILAVILALSTLWSSVPVYASPEIRRRIDTSNYEDAVYAGDEVDGEPSSIVLKQDATDINLKNIMYKEAPRFGVVGGPLSDTAPNAEDPHGVTNVDLDTGELEKVKSTDWMIQDKDGYYVNIWGEYIRYGGNSSTNLGGNQNSISTKVYDILGAKYMNYTNRSDHQKILNQLREQKVQNLSSPTYDSIAHIVTDYTNKFSMGLHLSMGIYDITTTVGDQNRYESIAQRYTSGGKKDKLGNKDTDWQKSNSHMLETTEYSAVDSYTINKVDEEGNPVHQDVLDSSKNVIDTVYENVTRPAHNVFEQTVNLPIMKTNYSDKAEYTYTRTRYAVNVMRRLRGTNHHSRYYVLGRQFDGKYKFEELITPYLDVSDEALVQPHERNGNIYYYGDEFYTNNNLKDSNPPAYKKLSDIPKELVDQDKIRDVYEATNTLTESQKQNVLEQASNAYGMNTTSLIYRISQQYKNNQKTYVPNKRGDATRNSVLKVRFSDLYEDWGFEDYDWTEGNKSALFYFNSATHRELAWKEDYSGTVTDSGLKIPGEAGLLNGATVPNMNANYYVQQPNPLDFNPSMIDSYWLNTSKYIDNNSDEYDTHVALDTEEPTNLSKRSELKGIIDSSKNRLSAMANAGYFKYWNQSVLEELMNYVGYGVLSQFEHEIVNGTYKDTGYLDKLYEYLVTTNLWKNIESYEDERRGPIVFGEDTNFARGIYNYNDVIKDVNVKVAPSGKTVAYTSGTKAEDFFHINKYLVEFASTQAIPSPKTWYELQITAVPEKTITGPNGQYPLSALVFSFVDASGMYTNIDDVIVESNPYSSELNFYTTYTQGRGETHVNLLDANEENFKVSSKRTKSVVEDYSDLYGYDWDHTINPVPGSDDITFPELSKCNPEIKKLGSDFKSNILISQEGYVLDSEKCDRFEVKDAKTDKIISSTDLMNCPEPVKVSEGHNGVSITTTQAYALNLLLYRPSSDVGIVLTDNSIVKNVLTPDDFEQLDTYDKYLSNYNSDICSIIDTDVMDGESGSYNHYANDGSYTEIKKLNIKGTVLESIPFQLYEYDNTMNCSFRQELRYDASTEFPITNSDSKTCWRSKLEKDIRNGDAPTKYVKLGKSASNVHYAFAAFGTKVVANYGISHYIISKIDATQELENGKADRSKLRDVDLLFEYSTKPILHVTLDVTYDALQIDDNNELLKVTTDLVSDPMIQGSKSYYWSMIPQFYSRILFSDYDYKPPTIRSQQWVQPGRDLNLAPHTHEKKQYYTYDFYYQELDSAGDKYYVNHTPLQFDLDYEEGYDAQDDNFKNIFSNYIGRTTFLYDELAKYVGLSRENSYVCRDIDEYPLGTKYNNARLSIQSGDARGMQEFNPTYKWALYPYYNGITDFNPFFCDRFANTTGETAGIDTYQATSLQDNKDSGLVIMNPWDVVWVKDDGSDTTPKTYEEVLKSAGGNKSNGLVGYVPAINQPNLEEKALTTVTFPEYDTSTGNAHIEIPGVDIHRFVILVRPRGYKLHTENVSVTTVEPKYATTDGMSAITGYWNTGEDTKLNEDMFTDYFGSDTSYEVVRAYDGYRYETVRGTDNNLYQTTTTSAYNLMSENLNNTELEVAMAAGRSEYSAITGTGAALVGQKQHYKIYNAVSRAAGNQGATHYPMLYGQLGYNNFDQRYIVDDNTLSQASSLTEVAQAHNSSITNADDASNVSYDFLRWGNYLSYKVERNVVPAGFPVIAELLPDYADGLHVIEAHTGEHYNLDSTVNWSALVTTNNDNDFEIISGSDSSKVHVNQIDDSATTNEDYGLYTQYTNYDNSDNISTSTFYNKVYNTNYSANIRDITPSSYTDEDNNPKYNTDVSNLEYIKSDGESGNYDLSDSTGLPSEARVESFNSMSNLKALLMNNFSASYYTTMDNHYEGGAQTHWYFKQLLKGNKESDYTFDMNGQRHEKPEESALNRDVNNNSPYNKDSVYRLLSAERTKMADSVIYHIFAFTMPSTDVSLCNKGAVNFVFNYDQTPEADTVGMFDNIQYASMRALTATTTQSTGRATAYYKQSESTDPAIYNGLGSIGSEKTTSRYYEPYNVEPSTINLFVKPVGITQEQLSEFDDDDENDNEDAEDPALTYDATSTYNVTFKISPNAPRNKTIDYKYLYQYFPKVKNRVYQVVTQSDIDSSAAETYDKESGTDANRLYAVKLYADGSSSDGEDGDVATYNTLKNIRAQYIDTSNIGVHSNTSHVVSTFPTGIKKDASSTDDTINAPWETFYPSWAFTSPKYSLFGVDLKKMKVKNYKNGKMSMGDAMSMQDKYPNFESLIQSDLSGLKIDKHQEDAIKKFFNAYTRVTGKFKLKGNAMANLEGMSKPTGVTQKNVTDLTVAITPLTDMYQVSDKETSLFNYSQDLNDLNHFIADPTIKTTTSSKPNKAATSYFKTMKSLKAKVSKSTQTKYMKSLANFVAISYSEGLLAHMQEDASNTMPDKYSNALTVPVYLGISEAEVNNSFNQLPIEHSSSSSDLEWDDPMNPVYFDSDPKSYYNTKVSRAMRSLFLGFIDEKIDNPSIKLLGEDTDVLKTVFGTTDTDAFITERVQLNPDAVNAFKKAYADNNSNVSEEFKKAMSLQGKTWTDINFLHIYTRKEVKGSPLNIYIPYVKDTSSNTYEYAAPLFGIPTAKKALKEKSVIKTLFKQSVDKLDGKDTDLQIYYAIPTKTFTQILEQVFNAIYSDDSALWDPFVQYQKFDENFIKKANADFSKGKKFDLKKTLRGITFFTGESKASPGVPIQARYSYSKISALKTKSNSASDLSLKVRTGKYTATYPSEETNKNYKAKIVTDIDIPNTTSSMTYSVNTSKAGTNVLKACQSLWTANYYYFSIYQLAHMNDKRGEGIFDGIDLTAYKSSVRRRSNYSQALTYTTNQLEYYLFLSLNNILKFNDIDTINLGAKSSLLNGANVSSADDYMNYVSSSNHFIRDGSGVHVNRMNNYLQYQYQWDNDYLTTKLPDDPALDTVNATAIIDTRNDDFEDISARSGNTLLSTTEINARLVRGLTRSQNDEVVNLTIGRLRYDNVEDSEIADEGEGGVIYDSNAYLYTLPYVKPFGSYSKQQYTYLRNVVNRKLPKYLERRVLSPKRKSVFYQRANTYTIDNLNKAIEEDDGLIDASIAKIAKSVDFTYYNKYSFAPTIPELFDDINGDQEVWTENVFEKLGLSKTITMVPEDTFGTADPVLTYNDNLLAQTYPQIGSNYFDSDVGFKSGAYVFVRGYYGSQDIGGLLGHATSVIHAPDPKKKYNDIVVYPYAGNNGLPIRYNLIMGKVPTKTKFRGISVAHVNTNDLYTNYAKTMTVISMNNERNSEDFDYDQATYYTNVLHNINAKYLNTRGDLTASEITDMDYSSARIYMLDINDNLNSYIPIYKNLLNTGDHELYDVTSKYIAENELSSHILSKNTLHNIINYSSRDGMSELGWQSLYDRNLQRKGMFPTIHPDIKNGYNSIIDAYSKWLTSSGYSLPSYDYDGEDDDASPDEDDSNDDSEGDDDNSGSNDDSGAGATSNAETLKWNFFNQVSFYEYEPLMTNNTADRGKKIKTDRKKNAGMVYMFPFSESGAGITGYLSSELSDEDESATSSDVNSDYKLSEVNLGTKFVIGLTHGGSNRSNVDDTWIILVPNSTGQTVSMYVANLDTRHVKMLEFVSPIVLYGSTYDSSASNFSLTFNPVTEKSVTNDLLFTNYNDTEKATYAKLVSGVGDDPFKSHTPVITSGYSNKTMTTESNTTYNVRVPSSYKTTNAMITTKEYNESNYKTGGRESTIYSPHAFSTPIIMNNADVQSISKNTRVEFSSLLPAAAFSTVSGRWLDQIDGQNYSDPDDDKGDKKDNRKRYREQTKAAQAIAKNSARLAVAAMDPNTMKWSLYTSAVSPTEYTSYDTVSDEEFSRLLGLGQSSRNNRNAKAFKHYFGWRMSMGKSSNTQKFNLKFKNGEPIKLHYIKDKDDSYKRDELSKLIRRSGGSIWTDPMMSSMIPSINIQLVNSYAVELAVDNTPDRNLSMMFSSDYHCIPTLLAASTLDTYAITGIDTYATNGNGNDTYVDVETGKDVVRNDTRTIMAANNTAGIGRESYIAPLSYAQYSADGRYQYEDVATYGLTSPVVSSDASNHATTAYLNSRQNGMLSLPNNPNQKAHAYNMLYNSADRLRYFKDLLLFGSYSTSYIPSYDASTGRVSVNLENKNATAEREKYTDYIHFNHGGANGTGLTDDILVNKDVTSRNKSTLNLVGINWIKAPSSLDDKNISSDGKTLNNMYVTHATKENKLDGVDTSVNTNYYYNNDMIHSYVVYKQVYDSESGKYVQKGELISNVDENITPEYVVVPQGVVDYASWYSYATRLTFYNVDRAQGFNPSVGLYQTKPLGLKFTYTTTSYKSTKKTDDHEVVTKSTPIYNIPDKMTYSPYLVNDTLGVGAGNNTSSALSSGLVTDGGYTGSSVIELARDEAQFLLATSYYYVHDPSTYSKSVGTSTRFAEFVGASMSAYAQTNHPGGDATREVAKFGSTPMTNLHKADRGEGFYANGLLTTGTSSYRNYTTKLGGNKVANDLIGVTADDESANYIMTDKKDARSLVEQTPYTDTKGHSLVNSYLNNYIETR